MTAVMMMAGGQQRVAEAYAECVRAGIPVQPPDVNHSAANFSLESAEDGTQPIRFGLACVKNVGQGIAEGIIEARAQGGPFLTIQDLFERVDTRHLNKRALESLVKAGAFDKLAERAALLANLDRLIGYAQREQKQRESGQTSLFALIAGDGPSIQGPELEPAPEATQQQKLTWEKITLRLRNPFAVAYGTSDTRDAFWIRLPADEGWGEGTIPPYYRVDPSAMTQCWSRASERTI